MLFVKAFLLQSWLIFYFTPKLFWYFNPLFTFFTFQHSSYLTHYSLCFISTVASDEPDAIYIIIYYYIFLFIYLFNVTFSTLIVGWTSLQLWDVISNSYLQFLHLSDQIMNSVSGSMSRTLLALRHIFVEQSGGVK